MTVALKGVIATAVIVTDRGAGLDVPVLVNEVTDCFEMLSRVDGLVTDERLPQMRH